MWARLYSKWLGMLLTPIFAGLSVRAEPVAMTEDGIRDCYYKSYRYEKSRNYDDAIKSLLLVYQNYPNGYTVSLRLGWLSYLKGNYSGAEVYYLTAIKSAPGSIEAKLGLLMPLLAQERYVEAESQARQLLEKDPFNFYGCLRLAVALRLQKKHTVALDVLGRVRRLYPADPELFGEEYRIMLAQGKKLPANPLSPFADSLKYQQKQQYKNAITAMSSIDRSKTTDYVFNLRLGWLYNQAGKFANAEHSYRKAMELEPLSVEPQLGFLLVLGAQDRHDKTESVGRKILQKDYWNYYANLRVATALRKQKKIAAAEKLIIQMLGLYPTDVSYLTELGLLRLDQSQVVPAKQIFYAVLTLDPENITAKRELAKL